MRRIGWLLVALCASSGVYAKRSDVYTEYNKFYVESEKDKAWEEVAVSLPAYPGADAQWRDLYISNTYKGKPKLMVNSIYINTDKTVHYILNQQSDQGFNNISTEAMYCPNRTVKIYGYGDDVNKRWIQPKKSDWRLIGTTFNQLDGVRSVLYQTFCVDGLPRDQKELLERIKTRAMR